MNTTFAATFTLTTPMINGKAPLDGVVAAVLTRRLGGDYQRAHQEIPFARENGVLCCSAGVFEAYNDPKFNPRYAQEGEIAKRGVFFGPLQGFAAKLSPSDIDLDLVRANSAKVRRPKREDELSEKELAKLQKDGVLPEISENTKWTYGESRVRECGNVLSFYQTMLVNKVWYFGITTDQEQFQSLVEDIAFLGKKGSVGFGTVDRSKTAIYFDEGSCNGIVDADGKPMRPIPLHSKIKVAKNSVIADVGYQPAYWDIANRAPCYVPDEQYMTKTFEQIDKEML